MSADLKLRVARDWRWLIGMLVLGYTLLVIGLPVLKVTSEKQLLQGLGVAALDDPFMDLRGVAAWCDAAKEGKDPAVVPTWIHLPSNAEPHSNFLMNYAPPVLFLGKLGLSENSVVRWGVGLALLYAASLWLLCGACSLKRSILWAFLICSPASVLAVERGNLDTLLFALLVLALFLRKYPWAQVLVIFGTSVLKFFPIAALLAPWKEGGKNSRLATSVAVAIFLIFLVMMHSRLAAIRGSLSSQYQSAFGCTTMLDLMAHAGVLSKVAVAPLHTLLKGAAMIALGSSFIAGCFFARQTAESLLSERASHAFFLSAPLLLGLFVLGPQMDYKWIFFLLIVPAALELIHSSFQLEMLVAKAWLGAILLYSWWTFFSDEGSLRNALLKQMVMVLAMLLSAFLAGALWKSKTSA